MWCLGAFFNNLKIVHWINLNDTFLLFYISWINLMAFHFVKKRVFSHHNKQKKFAEISLFCPFLWRGRLVATNDSLGNVYGTICTFTACNNKLYVMIRCSRQRSWPKQTWLLSTILCNDVISNDIMCILNWKH